jgi:ribosomal protein L23
MVRLIPNFRVQLVHHEFVKTFSKANYATFLIEPRMTKLELREYLTKVYSLSVKVITTVNLPRKNDSSKAFKKAVVIFD